MKRLLLSFAVITTACAVQAQPWDTKGNVGTIDGTDFIGTTDAAPLNFRLKNLRAARIDTANVFVGYQAGGRVIPSEQPIPGYPPTIHQNTAVGSYALYSNFSGDGNVAAGYQALYSNTTGNMNTAAGNDALYFNTTGSSNVAHGNKALYSNTTGNMNTAAGAGALYRNTTGHGNVANGYYTLSSNLTGNDNVAIGGFYTLRNNITGCNNMAIGSNALYSNETGNNNIAIGADALSANTLGFGNTAIGGNTLTSNVNGSLNTAIGVGAGPYKDLNLTSAFGFGAVPTASNEVRLGSNTVTYVSAAASLSVTSDERVKTNIKNDVPGMKFINLLEPLTYNYDIPKLDKLTGVPSSIQQQKEYAEGAMAKGNIRYSGLMAQKVADAARSIEYDFSGVHQGNDNTPWALAYTDLIPSMIQGMKELQTQISELKAEIETLKQGNNTMMPNNKSGASAANTALLSISPNPAQDEVAVKIPGTNDQTFVLTIYNMTGSLVNNMLVTGGAVKPIDIKNLTSGTYQVVLSDKSNKLAIASAKLIKN